jgi:porin
LDVELGATHPAYYFAAFQCSSINSCFQYLLYINAGYTSYGFAVPGGNITYNATKTVYAEAGVFAVQPNANFHVGYDFPSETYNGVLGMGEIGVKTDFAFDPYPYKVSLTGFVNTASHADLNAVSAVSGATQNQDGTSGVVFQAEKVVWRQDNGRDFGNPTPTALKLYASLGSAIDSTIPIQQDLYVGATLMSPFANRPDDRFGLKFDYLRISQNYAQYLSVEKILQGGNTSPYQQNTFVFEANAHIQLPLGIGFEPVFDYTVHPTSFYNPTSPVKARDGVYLGSTVIVPLGAIFGLAAVK